MNKRNFVRYGSELLPEILSKVTVSWDGHTPTESDAVNYSAQGITVVLSPVADSRTLPRIDDVVKVLLQVDRHWLTGTCVHVEREPQGSLLLGLHFENPEEQEHLQSLLFTSLQPPAPSSFVKHEWEELVSKLCDSGDPDLIQLGLRQRTRLMERRGDPVSA